jgi:hypothetical protein
MARQPRDVDDSDQIQWVVWIFSNAIKYVSGAIMLVVTYLHFETAEVVHVLASTSPELILKVALSIFFFSWWSGSSADLDLHKMTLVKDPNKGKITWDLCLVFGGFVFVGLLLLLTSPFEYVFAGVLIVFWIVLTKAGQYARDYTTPVFWSTEDWYKKRSQYYQLERLVLVTRYLYGPQMKLRNKVGFAMVGVVALVTYVLPLRNVIGDLLHYLVPSVNKESIVSIMPASAFFCFVIVTEAWQWMMPINVKSSLGALGDLRSRYALIPYDSD